MACVTYQDCIAGTTLNFPARRPWIVAMSHRQSEGAFFVGFLVAMSNCLAIGRLGDCHDMGCFI
jgi:hypothetical protein